MLSTAEALQFSSYRSVDVTFWVMNDNDGPDLAGSLYEHMVKRAWTTHSQAVVHATEGYAGKRSSA